MLRPTFRPAGGLTGAHLRVPPLLFRLPGALPPFPFGNHSRGRLLALNPTDQIGPGANYWW
jgi:hypothetical protein